MQKGCMFELSYEFDLCRDLIRRSITVDCKEALLNKLTSDLLGAHIEYVLNKRLSDYYRTREDMGGIIHDFLDIAFNGCFDVDRLWEEEAIIKEITDILENRIFEMFKGIDVSYALWQTSSVTAFIKCVQYLGDYRILEWHERSGIPYQGESSDITFEFSLSSLYTTFDNALTPFCGKYAGHFLSKYLDVIVRNMIDEAIFLNGNKVVEDPKLYIASAKSDVKFTIEFPYTRDKLRDVFPLMTDAEIDGVITQAAIVIENELKGIINSAVKTEDVRSWFVSDKVLTININRPLTKVDFGERLRVDIKSSIDNGDWVSPKLRNMAGY